uniref:Uncharacterized protein n=1 Tax=Rhizophora mucronata TaxID=61149 RepID=A0A2P2NEF3_RHIMU
MRSLSIVLRTCFLCGRGK